MQRGMPERRQKPLMPSLTATTPGKSLVGVPSAMRRSAGGAQASPVSSPESSDGAEPVQPATRTRRGRVRIACIVPRNGWSPPVRTGGLLEETVNRRRTQQSLSRNWQWASQPSCVPSQEVGQAS